MTVWGTQNTPPSPPHTEGESLCPISRINVKGFQWNTAPTAGIYIHTYIHTYRATATKGD
jgi:hypothetical protein